MTLFRLHHRRRRSWVRVTYHRSGTHQDDPVAPADASGRCKSYPCAPKSELTRAPSRILDSRLVDQKRPLDASGTCTSPSSSIIADLAGPGDGGCDLSDNRAFHYPFLNSSFVRQRLLEPYSYLAENLLNPWPAE